MFLDGGAGMCALNASGGRVCRGCAVFSLGPWYGKVWCIRRRCTESDGIETLLPGWWSSDDQAWTLVRGMAEELGAVVRGFGDRCDDGGGWTAPSRRKIYGLKDSLWLMCNRPWSGPSALPEPSLDEKNTGALA